MIKQMNSSNKSETEQHSLSRIEQSMIFQLKQYIFIINICHILTILGQLMTLLEKFNSGEDWKTL